MPISVCVHLPWGLFKYYLLSHRLFCLFSLFASKILSKVLIVLWFYELCASDSLSTLILKSAEMDDLTFWLIPWGMEVPGYLGDGGISKKWMIWLFGWLPGGWRYPQVLLMAVPVKCGQHFWVRDSAAHSSGLVLALLLTGSLQEDKSFNSKPWFSHL